MLYRIVFGWVFFKNDKFLIVLFYEDIIYN